MVERHIELRAGQCCRIRQSQNYISSHDCDTIADPEVVGFADVDSRPRRDQAPQGGQVHRAGWHAYTDRRSGRTDQVVSGTSDQSREGGDTADSGEGVGWSESLIVTYRLYFLDIRPL